MEEELTAILEVDQPPSEDTHLVSEAQEVPEVRFSEEIFYTIIVPEEEEQALSNRCKRSTSHIQALMKPVRKGNDVALVVARNRQS
ncbi:hypothetical protein QQ045_016954 [Rhodiola kirilowii]